MKNFICIATFNNRAEAGMAQAYLKEAYIHSVLKADDSGGMHPYLLAASGGAKIFVRKEDAEKAAEVLKNITPL